MTTNQTHRPLSEIARDIRRHWGQVNYAAKPYLDAMMSLNQIGDKYGHDDGKSIVLYFLGNARSFTGDEAKKLKAELKTIAGVK